MKNGIQRRCWFCYAFFIAILAISLASPASAASFNPYTSWNWHNALTQGYDLLAVTYGDNIFVAVGTGGSILTSPDGRTWTSRSSGTTSDLRRAACGNGTFVAVGDAGIILTSLDGETWTKQTVGDNILYGVTYGDGTFVAVGDAGIILTSRDGASWTSQGSGTARDLIGVTYGNGIFVTVGGNGIILTSPNGNTWTTRNSDTTLDLDGVAYGNGVFMIVGPTAMDVGTCLLSSDGVVWVDETLILMKTSSSWLPPCYGVSYLNGKFVVQGADRVGSFISTSSNGTVWNNRSTDIDNLINATAYGYGTYVAVGQYGAILTSPDGSTWTSQTPAATSSLRGVAYGNGLFVAVSTDRSPAGSILTSPDGAAWTSRNSGVNNSLLGVCYGGGTFTAVGLRGAILTSPDGVHWTGSNTDTTSDLYGIAYGNGAFVAVGDDGTILSSLDGDTWTKQTSGTTDVIYGIAYGNGAFVAVGWGGTILTSGDGATWFTQVPGTTYATLDGVAYGNGAFVAVGDDTVFESGTHLAQQVVSFIIGKNRYGMGNQEYSMDAVPFISDGRALVPVYYLDDALGAQTAWNATDHKITVTKGSATVMLHIGSDTLNVNGTASQMDVAPIIVDERAYLPCRYVAGVLGYSVSWDEATETISINAPQAGQTITISQ